MANLKSDLEGFLTGGEPLVSMRRSGDTAMIGNHLSSIDRNIAALTSAVLGGARLRGSARGTATVTAKLRGEAVASSSASRLPAPGGMIAVPGGMRDASGRFIKNGSSRPAGGSGGDGGGGAGGSNASMRNLAAKLTDAIKGGAEGVGDADPAVRAMQEVAGPLSRGLNFLRGDEGTRRQEGWFKRILKRLQGIEEGQGKPVTVEEGGSGVFGVLSRAVPALVPVIGGLAAAIAPLLALLGISNAAGDTSKDQARIDALKDGVAEPLKESLKEMGLDSDGRIAKNREAALAGRDGEYAKEDALKSQFVSPTNAAPGSRQWNDEFYNFSQTKMAADEAETKKSIWQKTKDWVLGQTSKMFESGKGGAGTVSSGRGDKGGASYGTYQLSSKMGTLQNFLASSKYGAEFAGLTPGSAQFNDKWKALAASDPAFGSAQHDFIKATHYDPAMKKLASSGIDLAGRGAAVQDAVWSTSVQFGSNGARSLIGKALSNSDVASMSDADIVKAIQEYKLANNDRLFAGSSSQVRAGTAARATAEQRKLLALATVGPNPIAPMGGFTTPQFPSIPDAPQLRIPLGSSEPTPVVLVGNTPDVSRDLANRRLAHIVTGGVAQ